ncbi:MAG TPA: flippase activity-associated protein Agl23 [candidate division Zixibacteria bacterium]|nr:flippase activity-associated protein Agl23 [candidate division Zixibacteria bacterium]
MTDQFDSDQHETQDLLSRPLISSINLDWEKTIYLIFVILALATRLYGVGDRVVSHDESLHTQYSYQYYNGQGYQHSPLMHGPSLFHATALSYWLFGDGDASSRIPVALIGTLLIILPYFLRGWVGSYGAIIASFLLLISPYITYYSRYIRHDIYIIAAAALVFIAIQYYLRKRKDKYLWWFAVGMALMFTTMETSFIYVAIFGSFLVLALVAKVLTADWFKEVLPSLLRPLLILLVALIVFTIGFAGVRFAASEMGVGTIEPGTAVDEGFAADPEQALSQEGFDEVLGQSETLFRGLQITGIFLLAASLFALAYRMRPQLEGFAEFDLIVLFTTLTLPTATSILVLTAGQDPMNASPGFCDAATSETLSAIQLSFTRIFDAQCRSALIRSDVFITAIFLIITLIVSILVGLWWNRRKWLIAAVIFHGIFLVLFTSFFTNPGGWASGMIGSLGYWLEQQEVNRADQPSFFYFVVLPLYEFLPLLFTLLAAHLWAKKQRLNKIIGYWLGLVLVSLLLFSFVKWYTNRGIGFEEVVNQLPAFMVAGVFFLVGSLLWIIVLRKRHRGEYDIQGSLWELLDVNELFGFIPYLIWWFLLSWLIFTFAGEKMAWLSTHFIFPMVLMAGWYMNDRLVSGNKMEMLSRRFAGQVALIASLIVAIVIALAPIILGQIALGNQEADNLRGLGRFIGSVLVVAVLFYLVQRISRDMQIGTTKRAWLLAVFALLSVLTIRFTYMAAYQNADYTNEFLVYAHGAPATKSEVLLQLEDLSMRMHGDNSIRVAYDNDSSWPYTWYLRDYPNRQYFGENPTRAITESPVVISGSQNWGAVEPILGDDYDTRTYTFLWWPMEEYRKISWDAIFGDPNAEEGTRRGIANSQVRQALWDIIFYRDYDKYGQVFGGTYTAGQWPLRHELRMYIRKDVLATLWEHGIDALAAEPPFDPYAEREFQVNPIQYFGSLGSGEGQLDTPRNVAVGPEGKLYVADSGNNRIQVFDNKGFHVTDFGVPGTGPGEFNEPWGIAVDDQFVYVGDTWNHRLQKFDLDGNFVSTIGQYGRLGEGESGGGYFFGPRQIVVLEDGNLLVTDTGNHRFQVLQPDGQFLQFIGAEGMEIGQFLEPVGIAQGPDETVYVADTWNGRMQRLNPNLISEFEWPVDAWYGESINNKPYVAVDSAGRVYVSDPEGQRILIFDEFGQYLGRFGTFSEGVGSLGLPTGIAIDDENNIYVVDTLQHQVLKFAPIFPDMTTSEGAEPIIDQP